MLVVTVKSGSNGKRLKSIHVGRTMQIEGFHYRCKIDIRRSRRLSAEAGKV